MWHRYEGDKNHILIVILEIIRDIPHYFLWIVLFYVPLKSLYLPDSFSFWIDIVFSIAIILQVIRFLDGILGYTIAWLLIEEWGKDVTTRNVITMFVRVFLRLIWGAMILMNFGIEITPLLASLWIWGIAIAFAFKNILEDVFASFSILMSKPFRVWDFIVIWSDSWTVKEIWFKSTRIKTLTWEELILPNKKVVETSISNYSMIEKRRVKFVLCITYDTKPEMLRKIPDICKDVIESVENAEHLWVVFKHYAESSLDFEIAYHTKVSVFKEHLMIVQEINYRLFEEFTKYKITFAYPTQTLSWHITVDKKII